MKMILTGVLLGLLFMLPAGCASAPERLLILTRFQDIKPNETPPNYDIFGPGEVPSVYVSGYDGQTVTIEIFDISTGELAKKTTAYVPKGKDYYWLASDLPAGSYKVSVNVGGISQEMKLFNLRK